jgi:membrane protein
MHYMSANDPRSRKSRGVCQQDRASGMDPHQLVCFRFDLQAPTVYNLRRRGVFCADGRFPGIGDDVLLYSLFADPHAIPQRVSLLAGVVPASIIDLIKDEIQSLAEKNMSTLSAAFLLGLLVSLWSANSGVSALFDALNIVHGETEERSLLRFYATTFAVTLGAVVYGLVAIIGVLPIAFRSLGLGENAENLSAIFRWPTTLLLAMIWLSIVYRVGPSRSDAKWRWVTWGSGLAAILLVVASMVFGW